ncbi:MAG: TIGR04563 family protein [Bradymonadaceae bacterium]
MTVATKKKMTLYLSEDLLNETKQEALRQDRSLSWIMEAAWKMARERLQEMPGVEEFYDEIESAG